MNDGCIWSVSRTNAYLTVTASYCACGRPDPKSTSIVAKSTGPAGGGELAVTAMSSTSSVFPLNDTDGT